MQAVILAGGKGTRLGEYTKLIPKPMVKIGNKPILWHLFKILSCNGINDFVICGGFKGEIIKNYIKTIKEKKWNIKYISTGVNTKTAKRIGMIEKEIKTNYFLMTYGDGLANLNLKKLLKFHIKQKKLATVTVVPQPPRFGSLKIKKGIVKKFDEKKINFNQLINGGFFILNREIFKKLDLKKNVMWEQEPMKKLVDLNELAAYTHKGFWQPMDTARDKEYLNKVYKNKKINTWKIW